MPTFGDRIKKLRNGRNSKLFAATAGISSGSLSRYENGESLPSLRLATRISERVGVSVEWLLHGTGPDPTLPGYVPPEEMERIVKTIHDETDREARAVLRKIAPDEDELVEKLSGRALTMILTRQLDEWTTLHKEHSDLLRENGDLRVEAERMRARISELERQLAEAGGAAPR